MYVATKWGQALIKCVYQGDDTVHSEMFFFFLTPRKSSLISLPTTRETNKKQPKMKIFLSMRQTFRSPREDRKMLLHRTTSNINIE